MHGLLLLIAQIPEAQRDEVKNLVTSKAKDLRDQFGLKEAQLSISLEASSPASTTVLTKTKASQLVALLLVLPHGVAKMSHAVSGEKIFLASSGKRANL